MRKKSRILLDSSSVGGCCSPLLEPLFPCCKTEPCGGGSAEELDAAVCSGKLFLLILHQVFLFWGLVNCLNASGTRAPFLQEEDNIY